MELFNGSSVSVPMHYGCFLGGSFVAGETSGVLATTTSSASAGDVLLPVDSSSNFTVDQVIVYCDSSADRWYSTKCTGVPDSTHITISRCLQCNLTSGSIFYSAYANFAHYGTQGAYAVADFTGDYMRGSGARVVSKLYDLTSVHLLSYENVGATIDSVSSNSHYIPGNSDYPAMRVVTTGSSQGVRIPVGDLDSGSAAIRLTVNFGTPNTTISLRLYSGVTDLISVSYEVQGDVEVIEIPFTCATSPNTILEVLSSEVQTWYIGRIEVLGMVATSNNINAGTHVILGDSWVTEGLIVGRLRTRWLGSATIISAGVGGNTSQQLIDRFTTDVVAHNPDYVWVMVGTNDYFSNISLSTFNEHIATLKTLIQAVHARGVFWDPSVGVKVYAGKSDWELTNTSINYTMGVDYFTGEYLMSRPWYSDAKHQTSITLAHTAVAVDDTNVVIPITEYGLPANLWTTVTNEDGRDVVFTSTDGSILQCEKVYFSASTHTMLVFVKLPAVSSSIDTEIVMQWGGTSNVGYTTAEKNTLWATINGTCACKAVFPYNNDVVDSSGVTTTGTLVDATYDSGLFGKAIKCTGIATSGHTIGGGGYAGVTPMTFLAWAKRVGNSPAGNAALVGGNGSNWLIDMPSPQNKFRSYNGTFATSATNTTIVSGDWYLASVVHAGTTIRHGVNATDITSQTVVSTTKFLLYVIGGFSSTYRYNGYISLPRYISGALSANQINTQYNIESVAATNGALAIGTMINKSSVAALRTSCVNVSVGLSL